MSGEFEAFYQAHYRQLLAVVSLWLRDSCEAEDLTQEVFSRVWQHWDHVVSLDSPESWMFRVASNACASRWRRLRTALKHGRLGVTEASWSDLSASTVDVARGLSTLSLQHRQVLVLHYCLDRSVETIASDLGVSTGTVKSRLSRARAAARSSMEVVHDG